MSRITDITRWHSTYVSLNLILHFWTSFDQDLNLGVIKHIVERPPNYWEFLIHLNFLK